MKNPMTSSGIKTATFQLVAQCLNQLQYLMLFVEMSKGKYCDM
jgi:hypothetical protein